MKIGSPTGIKIIRSLPFTVVFPVVTTKRMTIGIEETTGAIRTCMYKMKHQYVRWVIDPSSGFLTTFLMTEQLTHLVQVCGKKFKQLKTLNRHMKTHTGASVPCKACGKKFGSKVQMLAHFRVNHEGYNFSCPHCPAKFIHRRKGVCVLKKLLFSSIMKHPTRSQMSSHLVREHNEARKYACEFCGQRFIQKGHCNRHWA